MNIDKSSNESDSGATFPKSPPHDPPRTDAEYLQRQVEIAKAALQQTLREMADCVVRTVDLRNRVEQHPLLSLGAMAAIGFVAMSLTPIRAPAKLAAAAAPLLRHAGKFAMAAATSVASAAIAPKPQPKDETA